MFRRWSNRGRPHDWRRDTSANECVKFEVTAKKVDLKEFVAST